VTSSSGIPSDVSHCEHCGARTLTVQLNSEYFKFEEGSHCPHVCSPKALLDCNPSAMVGALVSTRQQLSRLRKLVEDLFQASARARKERDVAVSLKEAILSNETRRKTSSAGFVDRVASQRRQLDQLDLEIRKSRAQLIARHRAELARLDRDAAERRKLLRKAMEESEDQVRCLAELSETLDEQLTKAGSRIQECHAEVTATESAYEEAVSFLNAAIEATNRQRTSLAAAFRKAGLNDLLFSQETATSSEPRVFRTGTQQLGLL